MVAGYLDSLGLMIDDASSVSNPILGLEELLCFAAVGWLFLAIFSLADVEFALYRLLGKSSVIPRALLEGVLWLPFGFVCGVLFVRRTALYSVITVVASLVLVTIASAGPKIDLALLVRGIAWAIAAFVGAKVGASLANSWRAPTTRISANTSRLRIFGRAGLDCLIFVLYFANLAFWYRALQGLGSRGEDVTDARIFVMVCLAVACIGRVLIREKTRKQHEP